MSVAAAYLLNRRAAAAALGVGAAAALVLASLSNPRLARAVGEEIGAGLQRIQTVAAMLAERSPGERPEGALANLKPKRSAMLPASELPAVRGPGPAAYRALAGPPTPAPLIPPQAPLFTTVAGGPPESIPPVVLPTPGGPGGPPILSTIPPPGGGGGGGGVFIPTPTPLATPEVPPTPAAPVPEPATWAMILLGFAMIGGTVRARGGRAATARN